MDNAIADTSFDLLRSRVGDFAERITDPKLKAMFIRCFFNTLDTTVHFWEDGTTYVITGDIDAMWLRDSSAQVSQYLEFVSGDPQLQQMIKGLVKRQFAYIGLDAYANAFGKIEEGHFPEDQCEKHPYVWERKFELDSLCYPFRLVCSYYNATGDGTIFDDGFRAALDRVLDVFTVEQDHENRSDYYHYRPTEDPSFSVPNGGKGGPVKACGLVWSGYRPSDDPCTYGYFIPGNMFISCICKELLKLAEPAGLTSRQMARLEALAQDIDAAIQAYAVIDHPQFGQIYAYEIDGLGGVNLMDDANVPSLLSIPYMGYHRRESEIYQRTRQFVLSGENPYYFQGKCLKGVGSPHTDSRYVWHISLIMQGLTAEDPEEINGIVDMLLASDADTGFMHEGVHCDDPYQFTRSWFAWANSLFSLFLIKKADCIKYIRG